MLIMCNNLPRCLVFRAQFTSQAEFIFHAEQEVRQCSLSTSAFPIAGKIPLFQADFFMSGTEPPSQLKRLECETVRAADSSISVSSGTQ